MDRLGAKDWVDLWKRRASVLDEVHQRELSTFNYRAHLPIINALLDYAVAHATPKTTSGLVAMQQILRKAAAVK